MLSEDQFQSLAREGYNRIPLVRELPADLDTPLSVYLKLADGPGGYLFESVQGGDTWGRYSIIGLPAQRVFRVEGDQLIESLHGEDVARERLDDPLAGIDALRQRYRVPRLPGLPGFCGGLVGYFGFETIAWMEPRLGRSQAPDLLGTPDALLLLSEEVAVFDNLGGRLYLVVLVDPAEPQARAQGLRRLDALAHRLRVGGVGYPDMLDPRLVDEADFVSGFSREGFEAAVRQAQQYILAGDVFQVVLSQRMSIPFRARPVDVYRALRSMNPSPYMYFMDFGRTQVVGSSPEILARLEGDRVTVRPIAGTRPRGATPEEDRRLAEELLGDPKECAEHLMLIDLGRNDVGRICEPGSVSVPERMVIERYSHVMHIVSEVQGRLQPGLGYIDVLRSAFPAGTVSGAPKIRALEIIRELEPVQRNIYAGAVGYLGWWGDGDTAIAIRTAVIQDGQLHVQAGAGIVADSDPGREWEETMNKGRALFRAVARAAAGM